MSTKGKIQFFLNTVRCESHRLDENAKLLRIFKGQLLPFVREAIARTIKSPQSQELAMQRIPPINVLKRIVKKTSKLYSQPPKRVIKDGDQTAGEVLAWYKEQMSVDAKLTQSNEMFSLFENSLLEPYLSRTMRPCLRVIPSDRFVPFCYDERYDDEFPDGFIVVVGRGMGMMPGNKTKDEPAPEPVPVTIYKATDKDDFTYFDSLGNDLTAKYAPADNPMGENRLGRLPYVYINREANEIQPVVDSDTLPMTVLIPVLLTDINFAHMFQSFSVIYGINIDDNGLTFGPGVMWYLKSDKNSDQKAEVGTITPECDIPGGLELVASQLAFWLNTRGIKPGAVGEITAQNFQSGISKIVDEMDTSEERKAQVPFYKEAEERQLWDLILNGLHPFWRELKGFGNKALISKPVEVVVDFAEQLPLSRRGDVIKESVEELNAGLSDREECIKRLNPTWSEEEVKAFLERVDSNRQAIVVGDDGQEIEVGEPDAGQQPEATGGTGGTLLGVALNGAQISSMVEVVQSVASGQLPRTSGVQILAKGLAIRVEEADKLMADAGKSFKPESQPEAPRTIGESDAD